MNRRFNLDPADLKDLARRGNIIPLCSEIGADLLTPVAAFLRIAPGARQPPQPHRTTL